MSRSSGEFIMYCVVGGPLLSSWGLHTLRRRRLLENTPSSTVRAAAMGWVELAGKAAPMVEVQSPISGLPCCWWNCRVIEKSGKRERVIKQATSGSPFFLDDGTGKVVVDPLDADLHVGRRVFRLSDENPALKAALRDWGVGVEGVFGSSRAIRVEEDVIVGGQSVFAAGELSPMGDVPSYVDGRRLRFMEKLRAVKRDPARLAEADADKDGQVDPQEWDAFRSALEAAFEKEEEGRIEERPRGVLRSPEERAMILAGSESGLLEKWIWAYAAVPGGILIGGIGVFSALQTGMRPAHAAGVAVAGIIAGAALSVLMRKWR